MSNADSINNTEILIREYCEKMDVEIIRLRKDDLYIDNNDIYSEGFKQERLVIRAFNEGGCNHTKVDLLDLLKFVKENLPEIWSAV